MDDFHILVSTAFAVVLLLWAVTYMSYYEYALGLKEEIQSLKSKIRDIERDALLSIVSISKEKDKESKETREIVDILLKEMMLFFKQSDQALSLGLTHPNKTIRELAEKVLEEKRLNE